jgi:hypothetical protein
MEEILIPPVITPDAQRTTTDVGGKLDGSVGQVGMFLQELIEITGQQDAAGVSPLLELCFGDVVTLTTLMHADGTAWLSVTAMLGAMTEPESVLLISERAQVAPGPASEWHQMWHADAGHCVVWRRIPAGELRDERAVMDAIITTADQAASRLQLGHTGASEKH